MLYSKGMPNPEGGDSTPDQEVEPLFALGQVVATPSALSVLQEVEQDPADYITRHVTGDWGDLGEEDIQENEFSLVEGFRILSAYNLPNDQRLWIITEADRSATTLLLPSEY